MIPVVGCRATPYLKEQGMATPNGQGGWDLTDEDAAEVLATMDEGAPYHATYRGDVRGTFDSSKPMGPTYNGEYQFPVDAVYDPETDTTRVGFSKTPGAERGDD